MRLDIKMRDVELHKITLNYEKNSTEIKVRHLSKMWWN